MKILFRKPTSLFLALLVAGTFAGCSPDETSGNGNGIAETTPDASFTVTANSANNFTFDAADHSAVSHQWDFGDGNPVITGSDKEVMFFPDADTYMITHTAGGIGGKTTSVSQQITVTTPDPISGNLLLGGKFKTQADIDKWTVLNISSSNASVTLTPGTGGAFGKATFMGTGYQQKGIYQKVTLQANKEYNVDMVVSSEIGIKETWFEVYILNAQPVDGNDYGGDKILRLNSWDCYGSGPVPFNGLLSGLNCDADGTATKKGVVKVNTTGDYYFLIKSGGNQNSVINVSNISLRGKAN